MLTDRALVTQWVLGRAHQRAELHHGLVPYDRWAGAALRHLADCGFGGVHRLAGIRGFDGITNVRLIILRKDPAGERPLGRTGRSPARFDSEEYARQHPADVGVHHRDAHAEGEAQHRRGGVVADARQRGQLVVGLRKPAVVLLEHHAGALLQPQRPARVAEPPPRGDDLRRGGPRERGDVRPHAHPVSPVRHHPTHLGLLAHHLAHQHAPRRRAPESPRQVAGVGLPPCGQQRPHARHSALAHRFGRRIVPYLWHRSIVHGDRYIITAPRDFADSAAQPYLQRVARCG